MLSYKELQAQLKQLKSDGYDVTVKLNAKRDVLQAEFDRLMALLAAAEADEPTECKLPVDYYSEHPMLRGQSCLLPVKATATVKRVAIKPQAAELAKQVKAVAHPKPVKHEAIAVKPSKRQAMSFEAWQADKQAKAAEAKRQAELKYQAHLAECAKRRELAAQRQAEYIAERRYQAQLAHERRQASLLQEQLDRQARNNARRQRLASPAAQEASYYAGYRAA